MDTFDAAWDHLAGESKCDARGGAEYTRCRREWDGRGEMFAALVFIATHANKPSTGLAGASAARAALGTAAELAAVKAAHQELQELHRGEVKENKALEALLKYQEGLSDRLARALRAMVDAYTVRDPKEVDRTRGEIMRGTLAEARAVVEEFDASRRA